MVNKFINCSSAGHGAIAFSNLVLALLIFLALCFTPKRDAKVTFSGPVTVEKNNWIHKHHHVGGASVRLPGESKLHKGHKRIGRTASHWKEDKFLLKQLI